MDYYGNGYQPPQAYYPQVAPPQYVPPPRRRPRGFWAFMIFAGIALALLGVIVLVTVLTSPKPIANDPIATSAQVAAVCQAGSYKHPSARDNPFSGTPGVTDVAGCTARIAAFSPPKGFKPSERWGPIWIIQFSSRSAALDEIPTERLIGDATLTTIDGKTVLFTAPADLAGVALRPLAQFGSGDGVYSGSGTAH